MLARICELALRRFASDIWDTCHDFGRNVKERTISMKLVVDFVPIHGNVYMLAAALTTIVYGQITNINTQI